MSEEVSLEKIVSLAKQRGFIFPGSEIYGGLANSWDYGPLGALFKNNIKQSWWKRFVERRQDVVGVDTSLIMNPKVWEASGHLKEFSDPLVECKSCNVRLRADDIDLNAPCLACGAEGSFTEPAQFNMMFKTFIGPKEDEAAVAYFRPETAQGMFVNFSNVVATSRKGIPFGIAQMGKAFRNEITPGNYIFRTREFEQMEIEYFIHPDQWKEVFEVWLKEMHDWIKFCGIDGKRVHDIEVSEEERAFYSQRTVDIEFDFPFGREELYGIAYRGDYDLQLHAKASGKDMTYTDPTSGEKFLPHVVEPTFGVDRTMLAMMLSAYHEEEVRGEKRVVMKLPATLAPYQVAVLPLSRKDALMKVAEPIVDDLSSEFSCDYDVTQSIGKRYRRQDEIGTPYCVTVDFDSLEDGAVTVRDRDTMKQKRVAIEKVGGYISERLEKV
jgi:glycyl-tRNA synthetase